MAQEEILEGQNVTFVVSMTRNPSHSVLSFTHRILFVGSYLNVLIGADLLCLTDKFFEELSWEGS